VDRRPAGLYCCAPLTVSCRHGQFLMSVLNLSFACWDYDRVRPLADKSVRPEGIDLISLRVFPAETFQRMIKYGEFDLCEMGFKYCEMAVGEDSPFVGIPAFPVRLFPHSLIYVNKNSGIKSPRDLIGKRVGEPYAYGHDAAIWARGVLSDEYGVPVDSVSYHVGAIDGARRRDFAPLKPPPPNIRVEKIRPDQTLDGMLESGEIDALYCAMVPPSMLKRSPNVGRLFENYQEVEQQYFRKTGIFPIVDFVAVRRDLYRQQKWVAQSLYKAFKEAKAQAEQFYRMQDGIMHRLFMLPWLTNLQDDVRALMGEDWWPYGLEPNRKAIETFLRYHHEQGFSQRLFKAEELFATETLIDHSKFG
jgi:4,5-dihydroxyphthalate decarboxylase